MRYEQILDLPNFCAHEHWGSIASFGMHGDCFAADFEAGALPRRQTNLVDIVLDPYLADQIAQAGVDVDEIAREADAPDIRELAERSAVRAFALLHRALARHRLTGTYQCIRRGLRELYGTDIAQAGDRDLRGLSSRIARNYEAPFRWYREAMRKARFSGLIRPVHPEFFYLKAPGGGASRAAASTAARTGTAAEELAFTKPILRIDPLLAMGPDQPLGLDERPGPKDSSRGTASARREALVEMLGIEPAGPEGWRAFLTRLFDHAGANGNAGIKQLQAYRRTLDFAPRADGEVEWSGEPTDRQRTAWEDWLVHECCKQAHERGWPHQVHVGTHNLGRSSPLPLEALARRYPRMKIVQLHCWPFLEESGWLARHLPNVYVDTCWLPVLNPAFLRQALRTWLNYLPAGKIMCSHDASSAEMAAGSASFTREILHEVVSEQLDAGTADAPHLRRVAGGFLNDNAVRVYGIGKPVP